MWLHPLQHEHFQEVCLLGIFDHSSRSAFLRSHTDVGPEGQYPRSLLSGFGQDSAGHSGHWFRTLQATLVTALTGGLIGGLIGHASKFLRNFLVRRGQCAALAMRSMANASIEATPITILCIYSRYSSVFRHEFWRFSRPAALRKTQQKIHQNDRLDRDRCAMTFGGIPSSGFSENWEKQRNLGPIQMNGIWKNSGQIRPKPSPLWSCLARPYFITGTPFKV